MQKQRPPSFFQTRMTTLHQLLLLGLIAPACNMSFHMCPDFLQQWWQDAPKPFLEGFIIGFTLMLCCTWLAHPNSLLSREKMSWYSINNSCRHDLPFPWAIGPGPTSPRWPSVSFCIPPHSGLGFGFLGASRDSKHSQFQMRLRYLHSLACPRSNLLSFSEVDRWPHSVVTKQQALFCFPFSLLYRHWSLSTQVQKSFHVLWIHCKSGTAQVPSC